ncbi:MAG: protein phosphatase 2C domain-containing protein [Clostridia bacterium]|nr:protein phosphatase 2C domain-containing protein [Clostridia bacterium]
MRIINCNLRGGKHSCADLPCEDSISILQKNGVACVAIADGAGSKKYVHAKQGAQAVTKAVSNFLCERFDDYFAAVNELELRKVLAAVCHKSLKEEAEKLSLGSPETLASTMLCVAVKGNKMLACQIGDGVTGAVASGNASPLTIPQNGEFAGTTYFVNLPEAHRFIQIRKGFTSYYSHLFLMTDGVSESLYNEADGTFHPDLNRLIELSEKDNGSTLLEETVSKYIVSADPASDDCTIAIINLENSGANYLRPAVDNAKVQIEPVSEATEEKADEHKSKKAFSHKTLNIVLSAALAVTLAALVAVTAAFIRNKDREVTPPPTQAADVTLTETLTEPESETVPETALAETMTDI